MEKLVVGGDRTKLVDGVLRQVALVRELVDPVPVHGALCFVGADWPLVGGSFTARGVEVCWPGKLAKRLAALEGSTDVTAVGRDRLALPARLSDDARPANSPTDEPDAFVLMYSHLERSGPLVSVREAPRASCLDGQPW
ncbi:hypothetical protein [Curtobacterium sp. YR515]|uniref:hypothetical protein n=1 Tax=Curtobacterium sp. YR515 TaxID=1855316 RepID=UPI0020C9DFBF|nr:hypothetical protein [Curtobacterium sp. YR515]